MSSAVRDHLSMAGYHVEGLGNWKGRVALWGGLGILCVLTVRPSLLWVGLAILLGGLAGITSVHLAYKEWRHCANWVPLMAVVVLIVLVLPFGGDLSALAYFSLGSVLAGCEALASGLFAQRLVRRLNEEHRDVLEVFEKMENAQAHRPLAPRPPPRLQRDDLDSFLEALPEAMASTARMLVQSVVFAAPFRSLDSIPADHSSLSGAPLLDPCELWPTREGRSLEFLAQINLAQVPPSSRSGPTSGLLSFFYDAEEQPWGFEEEDMGSGVVLYHPDISSLRSVLKPESGSHPPLRKPLRFNETLSFTPSRAFEDDFFELLSSSDDEVKAALDGYYERLLEGGQEDTHRVFSPPFLVQNDMDDELALAAQLYGLPAETKWSMILQLDSDSDLGWCWGDAGCLYFWVPTKDLAEGRFDRSWVVLQCG
jgi:hypothetical protein